MHLRCGEVFNDPFIVNFLLSVPVKEIGNWSIRGKDMDKSLVFVFFNHGVVLKK